MLGISSGRLLNACRGSVCSKIFTGYGTCTSTRVAVVSSKLKLKSQLADIHNVRNSNILICN